MKIVDFKTEPIFEFRYLNAGRGPGQFYADRLPVHVARVDRLPEGTQALIATADLQGRELFEDSPNGCIRLLGETLPQRLVAEVLPMLSLDKPNDIGVFLAGDFYTVPALDKRGGTGDVTHVWQVFGDSFQWVVGVPGNHDSFGEPPQRRPRFDGRLHYLDGDEATIEGLRIAGLGGIIGKITKPHRRSEEDYLATLRRLLQLGPDVLLMHEGPDGLHAGQPGLAQVREVLTAGPPCLVIRGHSHWDPPFAELPSGHQVLNVDARVVIMTE